VVVDYTLYRNDGTDGSALIEITSYDFATTGFTVDLDIDAESMTAGKFFQFTYEATNIIGTSVKSPVVTLPVADVPDKPDAPTFVASTKTSLHVEWAEVAVTQGTAGLITGYYLYMDNGFNEDFVLIMSGAGVPQVLEFNKTQLTTGLPYQFYVGAENYLSIPQYSDISSFYACVAPSDIPVPTNGEVTRD